ncbi:MAG: hypothetical protein WCD53_11440 [Microcoleus sp.]
MESQLGNLRSRTAKTLKIFALGCVRARNQRSPLWKNRNGDRSFLKNNETSVYD